MKIIKIHQQSTQKTAQNHRKTIPNFTPAQSKRHLRCLMHPACNMLDAQGGQGGPGCWFSLHFEPLRATLGAILDQTGRQQCPKGRPKSLRKSMQKQRPKKLRKNMKKSSKIDQNLKPKSIKQWYDCGTAVFLFFAKSITLKSFFHMIRGVKNLWKTC